MENPKRQKFRIAYFLNAFPGLTTTFVDREIVALRNLGVEILPVAMKRPTTMLSENQTTLVKDVLYLEPINRWAVLGANLRSAFFHPLRYFGTMFYLVTRKHDSLYARRKTLGHFLLGAAAADMLRGSRVDHLHAHFIHHPATLAMTASRLMKLPYSITVHASGDIFVKPVMVREKLANSKFVATCSEYNRRFLEQFAEGITSQKVQRIYHGLDARCYQRHQQAPDGRQVILSVGQLRERKGFQYLIEACGILRDRGADFTCQIIGDGPERAALEQEIRKLGLEHTIELCGALPQEAVIDHYEKASVFTLPAVLGQDGDRDGIPNVILEAMAMELPVVSTRHSAIPEVIEDGKNGLLVPPNDAESLASALQQLLVDAKLRRTLGARGRTTVEEKFDPERNASLLLKAFAA